MRPLGLDNGRAEDNEAERDVDPVEVLASKKGLGGHGDCTCSGVYLLFRPYPFVTELVSASRKQRRAYVCWRRRLGLSEAKHWARRVFGVGDVSGDSN